MAKMDELLAALTPALQERSRSINGNHAADGSFVLYWMRTAVRADENPALETAIDLANRLNVPAFVYHAVSERYPYASDRHHTFIIEGARDVDRAMQERGVGYAFHLERPGQSEAYLLDLAKHAAIVVTEDMPVRPLWDWTELLARRVNTPVIAVDTACVVPMQLVGRAHDRAFAYRKATERAYRERLTRKLEPSEPKYLNYLPQLPFSPVDLAGANIADLVAQCSIDHAIGPVPHTRGGTEAGYERWRSFRENGLSKYARVRNNALYDGVSRMSAYLHYGMVSPFRIARETAELDHEGAEKFLDELTIWRELAYAFCFYRRDHDRLSALPSWARDTLRSHEQDQRDALFSWESLARGVTGDALWDAAQASLLIHGELHNNVRMTWGKALLSWTKDAKQALSTLIDLNHRYALDGRDPASYGGILWCLGQFDRPFTPEKPVLGTVRDRTTKQHAKRLDPMLFGKRTRRPLTNSMPRVAVVGAGLSGLMCARTLSDHGFEVQVFEKSRGAGGRMATRRGDGGLRFDHGAQYFTARDRRFRRYVNSWRQDGLVEPWAGRLVSLSQGEILAEKSGVERYVGVPAMNSICKHLAQDLKVDYGVTVEPLTWKGGRWLLRGKERGDLGSFDVSLISAPAPQAATLVAEQAAMASKIAEVPMHECWAVMLALKQSTELEFDGAFVNDSSLAWISKNSSKPGRSQSPETWVLHASSGWSHQNIELSTEAVAEELLQAFTAATGLSSLKIERAVAHRWRYALPPEPLSDSCVFDGDRKIGCCGDWCGGPRVEGAFLSGMAAAGRVLGLLDCDADPMVAGESQKTLF